MEKILISACFLGNPVRYDATALDVASRAGLEAQAIIDTWQKEGRLISICPEVAGGLPIPRPPAEINVSVSGSRVLTQAGEDVTKAFSLGADLAVRLCRQNNVKMAVLTESSPSCGSTNIYSGEFKGLKISGEGLTTSALRQNGIEVFSQFSLKNAKDYLMKLEANDE
jgi:uncharacterized protein YbbK (DUF523 family)